MSSRLLEEEMIVDQPLLISGIHVGQGVVFPGQVTAQSGQGVDDRTLHLPALHAVHGGWEAEPSDATSSTDTAGFDVFGIQGAVGQLVGGELWGWVLVGRLESLVLLVDDSVKDLVESLQE